MASESNQVYNRESQDGKLCLQLTDPNSSKTERMILSLDVPDILNVHRPLSEAEQEKSGYIKLRDEQVRLKSKAGRKDVEMGFCRYLSPRVISEHPALWDKLCRMQYIFADPDFIDFLEKSYPRLASHLYHRGTCHDLGVSVIPGHHQNRIHLSPVAKKGSDTLRELHILMAEVYQGCLELADLKVDHTKHWAANASITVGHHKNIDFTGAQVNYSKEGNSFDDSLKCKAHVHVDGNDDACRPTVLPFLNKLSKKTYSGIMNLTSVKLSCSGEEMGVLVFSGRGPHAMTGYGKYEEGFDVDSIDKSNRAPEHMYQVLPDHFFKGRISVPMYCRMDNIEARVGEVAEEMWDDKALVVFGTRRNHQTWKMRFYIKENLQSIVDQGTTPEELCEMFAWLNEDGEKEQPDLEVAQLCLEWAGKTIPEYEELHTAAIYAACGIRIPKLDEDGNIVEKTHKRKVVDEEGVEVEEEYCKTRCDRIEEGPQEEAMRQYVLG